MKDPIERHYAVPVMPYKGRQYFRVPVRVTFGEDAALRQVNYYPSGLVWIVAPSAQDAANHVMDMLRAVPCVEVEAWGPKGGHVHRYHGWDTAIFWGMEGTRHDRQLPLF